MKLEISLLELKLMCTEFALEHTNLDTLTSKYSSSDILSFKLLEYAEALDSYVILHYLRDSKTINEMVSALATWYGKNEVLNQFSDEDLLEYVANNFDNNDVIDYVTQNCDINDVLGNYSERDIRDYVTENYYADDWTSVKWR